MDEYPEEMEITWKKIQNENEIILAVGDKVHYEDEKRFSVDHSREGNEIECIKAVSVLNTWYATDSTLVCPVKMEYGPENNIFILKMMMKSGLEKNILKFLHAQAVY